MDISGTNRLTFFRTSPLDDLLFFLTGILSLALFALSGLIQPLETVLFAGAFSVALVVRHFIPPKFFRWTRIVTETLFSVLLLSFLYMLNFHPDSFFTSSFYLVSAMLSLYSIRLFSQYEAVYFLSFPLASVLLTGSVIPLSRSFIVITLLAITSLLLLIRADWSYFNDLSHPSSRTVPSLLSARLVLPIQFGIVILSILLYLNLEGLPTLQSPFLVRTSRPDAVGPMIQIYVSASISPRYFHYSGLSPTLRLTTPEKIHLSDKPVFRVRAPYAGYWRAVVFSTYTGKSWKIAEDDRLNQLSYSEITRDLAVSHSSYISGESPYFSRVITHYEFLTDFTNVLPALYLPDRILLTSVSSAMSQSYLVFSDSALSLRLSYFPRKGFSYSVNSLVPNTNLSFSDFPVPSRELRVSPRYLVLPASLPVRVRSLAQSVVADSLTPYQKVRSLTRFLRDSRRFSYTLSPPPIPEGADPVDFFLFESHSGYCEIFAASLAVMLRSVGIPARVVGGFLGGEYDVISGSLLVRERDAHAWVEAFVEPWGWITADATPEAPDAAFSASSDNSPEVPEGPATPLADRMFRSRLFYFISLLASLWNSLFFSMKSSLKTLSLPLILAIFIPFILLGRRLLNRLLFLRKRLFVPSSPVLKVLYLIEARSRLHRSPSESLRSFFSRVSTHFPSVAPDLLHLCHLLEAFLYGSPTEPHLPRSALSLARSLRFDKPALSVVKET